ncbi:MAG TPA: phosphoenolpyruvate--protein phosphotransferase [Oscillospiraceae bacterium]|nr:phosphoenolpyruvate--protein phosphotransferase [Oscillospiraceae bacterium]
MHVLKGKSVFGGIAMGKLSLYKRMEYPIEEYTVEDTSAEVLRFEAAKEKAITQLQELCKKAVVEVGEVNAMIFNIHQMMLNDLDYCDSIINIIQSQKVNAEYAVNQTSEQFAQMFSTMDDPYMKERAADVKDVSKRVIHNLSNQSDDTFSTGEPVILVADDLTPSETVQFDKTQILAFVTMHGSINSHTAILARTMNIPAVVSIGDTFLAEYDGLYGIVDGLTGMIYIDPDEETMERMKEKQEDELQKRILLQEFKGKENCTLDGHKIEIYANIGSITDMVAVVQNDAGGIGLFRSEFLYLENQDYPTEEQQFTVYKTIAENMKGKKVIIRTLDIGADKQVSYFNLSKEENPALGYRAIRICMDRQDIFKTQLKAIYRASVYGNIAIMFPMIISLDEILKVNEIIAQVKSELVADHIPFRDDVEVGIMIETPAAAVISDMLAKEVDFFSIGTNDLTQYTLAIDRQNELLNKIYDPHHPAILRLIKMIVDNAHANGIWAGICGELAADLSLTETFLTFGVDELSVSPGLVLGLRKQVRSTDVSKVKDHVLSQLKE